MLKEIIFYEYWRFVFKTLLAGKPTTAGFLYLAYMSKKPPKSVKNLPVKEKPLHIPLKFGDALQRAPNTQEQKSKIKK